MLLAITSNGKVGLGVLAGLLIAFAILSAFYFPRRNPDFPGNRLGLFILVSVVLFAGTMVGVIVFAAEEGEPHSEEATQTQGEEPPTSTEQTTTDRANRGRRGGRRSRLRIGRVRQLPHARGRGGVRHCRTEPRRGEAGPRSRRRSGHEREGRDAVVQGAAQREADPGRGGLCRPVHARLAPRSSDTLCPPGEVSERPKERDWKSRKRRKAFRGFKSRPLRRPKTPSSGVFGVFQLGSRPSVSARFRNS